MANRTKRTPKSEEAFLSALANGASVTLAGKSAGIGRSALYMWREDDKEFAKRWDSALESGTDLLEDEAKRRAVEGVKRPVYQGGECVGYVQEYSDTLLIFLLKGRRPEKYRDSASFDFKDGKRTLRLEINT